MLFWRDKSFLKEMPKNIVKFKEMVVHLAVFFFFIEYRSFCRFFKRMGQVLLPPQICRSITEIQSTRQRLSA